MYEQHTSSALNLAQALRIPYQALVRELHRRLAEAGYADIRPTYTLVFAHLDQHGMRLGEFAERAQLSKQLITYLVAAVERLGYVERLVDPTDGRARLVRLTSRGVEAARTGREIINAIEVEWAQRLGADAIGSLRAGLERLVELTADGQTAAGA